MKNKKLFLGGGIALCLGVSLGLLTNCVGYVETSRAGYYQEEDDYVYYPDYEVYYSQRHHQYVYYDGSRWERREAPPRVSIDILMSSPSYRMSFHDAPERHHSDVRRKYRGHGWDHDNRKNQDDDDRDNGHGKHKDRD